MEEMDEKQNQAEMLVENRFKTIFGLFHQTAKKSKYFFFFASAHNQ